MDHSYIHSHCKSDCLSLLFCFCFCFCVQSILTVLLVVVPLGYVNLTNNIIVQKGTPLCALYIFYSILFYSILIFNSSSIGVFGWVGAFLSIIAMCILWTIDFSRIGFEGSLPFIEHDQKQVYL